MTLENIGKEDTALLCIMNQTACCRQEHRCALGNWFFPNKTRVNSSSFTRDLYRTRGQTRGQMMVKLNRRRGGEGGIYHCEIHDASNVIQRIYIGVYTAGTGE